MQFFVLSCTFHDAEEPEIPLPTVKASMAGAKMLQRFFASQGPEASEQLRVSEQLEDVLLRFSLKRKTQASISQFFLESVCCLSGLVP